ncbi:hypothetical protein KC19_VG114400 [Ceratodon purpureus]|uniref:Mitochondrial import inner membrane translocase subunit TIM50 n=1 Tax=Ceratodon purpureus TaxID=3225 RepID=A0A8T0HPZ5_CERPU|nr:hypothetical protein KC19_VG114400 [Ceratodon purpureus]
MIQSHLLMTLKKNLYLMPKSKTVGISSKVQDPNSDDSAKGPPVPSSVPAKVIEKVPGRRYSVVLDLNGVLVHRRNFVKGKKRPIMIRPSCHEFLNWLHNQAMVAFWTSIAPRNIPQNLHVVLQGTSLQLPDVQVLSQNDCIRLSYVESSKPDKPFCLKDLRVFAKLLVLESVEEVLLVDDSPQKNLLNDPHNAVHPPTWSGDGDDRFLTMTLKPWLEGLFRSGEAVPEYVKLALLPFGQFPMDRSSDLALKILRGA